MNIQAMIDRLAAFPAVLRALCEGLARDDALFRADGKSWSVLEVVCHLADEEEEDFRARVESTLRDPGEAWSPIDPEGAASERSYRARDLETELARFDREREASVAWLRRLKDSEWDNAYQHPSFGPIRAGDVMASWCAHDALHLRQIGKRLFELSERDSAGYSTAYAGEW